MPGTTIRILEDPLFDVDVMMVSNGSSTTGTKHSEVPLENNDIGTARFSAAQVLEKARDRFDRFWNGPGAAVGVVKEESV